MCGDSRTLAVFNASYYRMSDVSFDGCLAMMRTEFPKEISEGRLTLEKRVREMETTLMTTNNYDSVPNTNVNMRPRAQSEKVQYRGADQVSQQNNKIIPISEIYGPQ
jgi:hypothetical protein